MKASTKAEIIRNKVVGELLAEAEGGRAAAANVMRDFTLSNVRGNRMHVQSLYSGNERDWTAIK